MNAENGFEVPLLRAVAWSLEPGILGTGGMLEISSGPPDASLVEPLLRRRLSALGKGMIHCAARASEGRGPLRAVFASRHGEPARALPMLEDMAAGLDISPTQFSMNVHNAVAGIWSIARKDPSAITALGAGAESFGWGLLEALALHQEDGGPVLFVFGDDALPGLLSESLPEPLHALALLLDGSATFRLRVDRDPESDAPYPASPQSLHALRALAGEAPGAWAGPRGAWTFRLL
ncbi:MAG: beta-ketoacyl synthase chain length factor [Acidobacteria bacterium]|nr:beta-ketoacyl synthase chain length factor [Acidobacteriota bacterium]